jgi:hypothetical protein
LSTIEHRRRPIFAFVTMTTTTTTLMMQFDQSFSQVTLINQFFDTVGSPCDLVKVCPMRRRQQRPPRCVDDVAQGK